jgi:hypothetical protein
VDPVVEQATVEARYQRPGRLSRRGRAVLGGVGVLTLTGVVGWVGLNQAAPPLTATVLGYDVTSDRSVDLRFQVDKASAAKSAVCTLRARASSGEEVGRVEVPVPAGAKRQVLTATVKTSGRAINGDVLECRLG